MCQIDSTQKMQWKSRWPHEEQQRQRERMYASGREKESARAHAIDGERERKRGTALKRVSERTILRSSE